MDAFDGLDEPRVDLLDLAGEDQVRVAQAVELDSQAVHLHGAGDQAVEGEAEPQRGDAPRDTRTGVARVSPENQRDDGGQTEIGAGEQREDQSAHLRPEESDSCKIIGTRDRQSRISSTVRPCDVFARVGAAAILTSAWLRFRRTLRCFASWASYAPPIQPGIAVDETPPRSTAWGRGVRRGSHRSHD